MISKLWVADLLRYIYGIIAPYRFPLCVTSVVFFVVRSSRKYGVDDNRCVTSVAFLGVWMEIDDEIEEEILDAMESFITFLRDDQEMDHNSACKYVVHFVKLRNSVLLHRQAQKRSRGRPKSNRREKNPYPPQRISAESSSATISSPPPDTSDLDWLNLPLTDEIREKAEKEGWRDKQEQFRRDRAERDRARRKKEFELSAEELLKLSMAGDIRHISAKIKKMEESHNHQITRAYIDLFSTYNKIAFDSAVNVLRKRFEARTQFYHKVEQLQVILPKAIKIYSDK